ncbi:hypothetical protein Q7P37_002711 [Cladosporium fusiforme]
MADEPTSTSQSPPRTRRGSFIADMFGGSGRQSISAPRNVPANNNNAGGDAQQGQYPGPITNAAAQAQRRRMSLTTLGLSGSPTAPSPFGSFRGRRESFSSANSGSIDESAIEDEFAAKDQSTPTTPFARRMSFGARAMRDIRSSTGGSGGGGGDGSPPGNGRSLPPPAPSSQHARQLSTSVPSSNGTISSRDKQGRGLSSLPHNHNHHHQSSLSASSSSSRKSFSIPFSNRRLTIASATGEGFNWSENLRSRAERTASIAGPSGGGGVGLPLGSNNHARAKSVATMEAPVREMPAQPKAASKKPDHFQERILKGDFYMD